MGCLDNGILSATSPAMWSVTVVIDVDAGLSYRRTLLQGDPQVGVDGTTSALSGAFSRPSNVASTSFVCCLSSSTPHPATDATLGPSVTVDGIPG